MFYITLLLLQLTPSMLYYIKPETQLFTLEASNALISKTAIKWMDALMNAVCINITLTTIFPSLIK